MFRAQPSRVVASRERRMLREGSGVPLVLLHGVSGSSEMWRRVIPLLAPHHDVLAPTALGHAGGPPARERPATFAAVIDDIERWLDEMGIASAHLAGNSMGGWVALELARRGRALSVCALSPAGTWLPSDRAAAVAVLKATAREARAARFTLPWLAHLAAVRRFALRSVASDGAAVSHKELISLSTDLLECEVMGDLLGSTERLETFSPSCPVTLAWAGDDRVLPPEVFGDHAQKVVSGARYVVLPGVGHVPMLDSPEVVARTILETIARRTPRPNQ